MKEPIILGVDIAKKKFDVALLVNDKQKHKVFTNNQEGFRELLGWLKKKGLEHVHLCLEASSTYGDELATYMHDAGHTVSIVNPARIKGFAPREFTSGSSIKSKPRLSKVGNARLRKALFMPALVSIQCNPVIQTFYHRLKGNGKNGKVIVCAIMRKLVHLIFGILKSGRPFDPNYRPHCA